MQELEDEIIEDYKSASEVSKYFFSIYYSFADSRLLFVTLDEKPCHSSSLTSEMYRLYLYSTITLFGQQWQSEDKKLLKTTDRVDYDVESFSGHLSEMLDARIKQLTSLRSE